MERQLESDDDSFQLGESDQDGECPDDDDFKWEKLAIFSSMSDDPIEVFEGFIDLFMHSEYDELFNQIMDRITSNKYLPIAIEEALGMIQLMIQADAFQSQSSS